MLKTLIRQALPCIAAATMAACSGKTDTTGTSDTSDVLVVVGDAALTRADLTAAMPAALGEDDSLKFARAYIRTWIDTRLVSEVAAKEIDMTEIDRMVEQYRKELIMWEYSRRMYESHKQIGVPEDSIMSYYASHADELKLKRPMVRGVYIKVSDESADLLTLRKLYRSTKHEDLDRLEKTAMDGRLHYDYFMDRWVDWEQIETLMPYDFSPSPDAFLAKTRYIDFSKDGYTYLLNITDVLPSGKTMPYEAARDYIIDRLTFHDMRAYDLELKDKLYDLALKDGKVRLKPGILEP